MHTGIPAGLYAHRRAAPRRAAAAAACAVAARLFYSPALYT